MTPTTLYDLQDRNEGGSRMVNDVALDELGPKNKRQFDYVIHRASMLTKIDDQLPSVRTDG